MTVSRPSRHAAAGSSTWDETVPAGPRRRGWRDWDAATRATVIGTVVTVLGLVVAVGAWQRPQSPPGPGAGTGGSHTGGPPSATARVATGTAATGGPAPAVAYLAGAAFPVESGEANLVPVPRAVRGRADYTAHAIAVSCPSNQAGDQEHDVTYLVRGRYVQFDAQVHPYYPPGSDTRSATYVTALIGVRQRDNDLTITPAGRQQGATPDAPAPLTATIDNAEKLTLRIQCGDPNGTVVLTDPRLTAG